MYVTQVLIKGFRSLQDVSVKFYPGINVLVGKNNAGKSNIIRALDIVLGEKWPPRYEAGEKDFYRASSDEEPVEWFRIAVCLEGKINTQVILSENAGAYIYPLRNEPSWDNYEDLSQVPDVQYETSNVRRYNPYRRGKDFCRFLENVDQVWLYLLVPRNNQEVGRVFAANVKDKQGNWYRLWRIGNPFREALLTTAFVPSFRDPSNQLRINSFTWYGRLVRHLYEQQTDEQRKSIQEARQSLTQTLDDIFQQATESLRNRLSRAIAHHRISFKAGAFTRDDAYKQITLFVDDGIDAPFYDKGSGIQSALIIALFAQYCEEFHQGGSLLLVEEPEIYLHPQGRRALEAQLAEFARPREGGGERQVIISTHSPEFLRSAPLHQMILVYKPQGSTSSSVHQINPDDFDERMLQKIQKELATKNAEMLFADHVLLVEGGEEHLLPTLADLHFGELRWFDTHNVSVVPVRGKGNFAIYSKILTRLGISSTILADLDFLKDGLQQMGIEHSLSEEAKQALATIRTRWKQASSAQPSGRRVKEKLFHPSNRDWRRLYIEVDAAIAGLRQGKALSQEQLNNITELWDSLKDRVSHKNFEAIVHALKDDLSLVIDELRGHEIFVFSYGELEDYFTEEAMQLGGGSKEIRALNVAEKIAACSSWEEIQAWTY